MPPPVMSGGRLEMRLRQPDTGAEEISNLVGM